MQMGISRKAYFHFQQERDGTHSLGKWKKVVGLGTENNNEWDEDSQESIEAMFGK